MSAAEDDVRRLYQEVILRHSRAPLHAHRPHRVDATGTGDNPMCGDRVQVFVQQDQPGILADVGFEARGCAISLAAADLMAALAKGATATHMREVHTAFIRMIETGEDQDPALAALRPLAGVHDYPSRRRCATLPWHALMQALDAVA